MPQPALKPRSSNHEPKTTHEANSPKAPVSLRCEGRVNPKALCPNPVVVLVELAVLVVRAGLVALAVFRALSGLKLSRSSSSSSWSGSAAETVRSRAVDGVLLEEI